MINLIPPQGRTAIRREYVLRVVTTYTVLLTGALLSAGALLVPTYVLVSSQHDRIEASVQETEISTEEYRNAERIIDEANRLAAQLGSNGNEVRPSEIIAQVRRAAPPGIRFSTFQFAADGHSPRLSVLGVATSRATLASFKTTLEQMPKITEVEVPISDLARDTNLPFAITLDFKTTE